jgi:hypothetical protein
MNLQDQINWAVFKILTMIIDKMMQEIWPTGYLEVKPAMVQLDILIRKMQNARR